ncbi:MAG: LodA/GoxA family CTQ-dependent oxidase [Vicinamibacterales bacterium]
MGGVAVTSFAIRTSCRGRVVAAVSSAASARAGFRCLQQRVFHSCPDEHEALASRRPRVSCASRTRSTLIHPESRQSGRPSSPRQLVHFDACRHTSSSRAKESRMAVTYRIHPAVGVARVGDSLDDHFVGPEAPGVPPSLTKPDTPALPPGQRGTYKDRRSAIKRQGARFRVYEYTSTDTGEITHVREVTAADARIEWEVHLANRKAAANRIPDEKPPTGKRRNPGVPEDRLVVDPGPQTITGASQPMTRLQGRFMDAIDVPIGDLLTDAAGRLIVLGGFGLSQSVPVGAPVKSFANNDGWCDDMSDGPVRATLTLTGGASVEADPAWVVVAPPDFAPAIENVVTLYDVVYDQAAALADPSLAVTDTSPVSFTRDIYPLLKRVSRMRWVSRVAAEKTHAHGEQGPHDFVFHVKQLSSNTQDAQNARTGVFRALRNPLTGVGDMPKLPEGTNENVRGAFVTPTQYKRMKRWAEGTFEADWTGAEPAAVPLDQLPEADQPHALDRAALEACVGGPFYPGIEVCGMVLDAATYDQARPFRISTRLRPGDLTAQMAIPWQADFRDCDEQPGDEQRGAADWWPGQRPTHVLRGRGTVAESWVPPKWKHQHMVELWMHLGFVVEDTSSGVARYVERERTVPLTSGG